MHNTCSIWNTNRHNKVALYIHRTVCKFIWLQVIDRYCEHTCIPERVINANGIAVIWDVPFITDRTVPANRPGSVLHDTTEKTCLMIDIALPDVTNFNIKGTEEISNYKYSEIAVSRMWKLWIKHCVSYSWSIRNNCEEQNLQILPGHRSAIELPKVTLMSTQNC
jgi:hypothetical protein